MKVKDFRKEKDFSEKVFNCFRLKAYFDKGFGFLSMAKYAVILLGFERVIAKDPKTMILIMIGYAVLCFALGFVMYHYKVGKIRLIEYENEVANRYNLFQKQLRDKLKIEKFK